MGRSKLYIGVVLAVVLAVAIGVFVASRGGDEEKTAAAAGTVPDRVVVRLDSTSVLDWQVRATSAPLRMANPAYERLIARNPDTNKIVPWLATSWKVEPAAPAAPKSITFTIGKQATCPGGAPITAEVVRDSFQRFIDVPKESNQLPEFFGNGPYKVSADASANTFTFSSETPFRNMLSGFLQAGIICPEGLNALKSDSKALTKKQYGSGPYVMQSLTQDNEAVWTIRPEWNWGPEGKTAKDLPKTLVYRVVGDQTTAANLLLSGDLDVSDVFGPDVDRLLSNKNLVSKKNPHYQPMVMNFNMRPGKPTEPQFVRQAISTAIDPQKFNEAAFAGRGVVAAGWIRPGVECYNADIKSLVPKPDIAAARKILTSNGYAPGSNGLMVKDGQPITVRLITSVVNQGNGGEYLASALRDTGFDVKFTNMLPTVYGPAYVGGDWDIAVSTGNSGNPDAGARWNLFSGDAPPKGSNSGATGDAAFAELYKQAMAQAGSASCATLYQMQQQIYQKSFVLPLVFADGLTFGSGKVSYPAHMVSFEPIWMGAGTKS